MAVTDKFIHVGLPGTVTSLQSPGKALAAASINIGSASNWVSTGEAVYFAIRVVDPTLVTAANPSGVKSGTYTEWKGTLSGTTVSNLQLQYGADQVYPAGANTQVYITISAAQMNSLVDGILAHANQDGSLKVSAVQASIGFTKTTDANGWTKYDYGTWQQYYKKGTTSTTVAATPSWSSITISANLPVGMSTIGTNFVTGSIKSQDPGIQVDVGSNPADSNIVANVEAAGFSGTITSTLYWTVCITTP